MKKFTILFNEKYFYINDLVKLPLNIEVRIVEMPKRKWYKVLLQYLTFGIYKAPWEYKIEKI